MANVKILRRRIKSVKNIQQLTKAMKMVAAAKLRKAQEQVLAGRPYASNMEEMLNQLLIQNGKISHPLLNPNGNNRIALVLVTGDKGLCGSFNNNAIKAAESFMRTQEGRDVELHLIGKKGVDHFRRRPVEIAQQKVDFLSDLDFEKSRLLANDMIERYLDGKVGKVTVIYNAFRSVIHQVVTQKDLLPFVPAKKIAFTTDFIFEPSAADILAELLPTHIAVQTHQILKESAAAENGARMTAMENATNNARDVISQLTLTMNKIRQAAITKEIIEVTSGAEALKG